MSHHLSIDAEGMGPDTLKDAFPTSPLAPGDAFEGSLDKDAAYTGVSYRSMDVEPSNPMMGGNRDYTRLALPYLHPSDPTTYTALPTTLLQNDYEMKSDPDAAFSGFDWSGNGETLLSPSDGSMGSSVESPSYGSPEYIPPGLSSTDMSDTSSSGSGKSRNLPPDASSGVPVSHVTTRASGNAASVEPKAHATRRATSAANSSARGTNQNLSRKPMPYSDGYMTVTIDQQLINRLQWYQLTCQLIDANGNPLLRNQSVSISPAVAFVDGRRRADAATHDGKSNGITVTAVATCASTGQHLEKCIKCREKDKALRKRKRKRDQEELWQEQDEIANTKLVQLYSTGTEQVNDEGILNIRLRIGCCIGVTKQHHLNHVKSVHEGSKEVLEIHKSCEGTVITVILTVSPSLLGDSIPTSNNGLVHLTASTHTPIRVLGKVTDAERQKLMVKESSSESRGVTSSSDEQSSESDDNSAAALVEPPAREPKHDRFATHTAEAPAPKLKKPVEVKHVPMATVTHSIEPLETPMIPPEPTVETNPKRTMTRNDADGNQTHFLPTDAALLPAYAAQVPNQTWPGSSGISDIEELSMGWRSRRQFKGCSSCAAKGDRELFSTISPSKINPLIVLQHFGKAYKSAFERAMPSTNLEVLSQRDAAQLFAQPSLDAASGPTPAKLQVYSVLAVCSCITGFLDSAHKFWSWAIEIADSLLALPLTRDPMETAIFADGLNRLAYYFGAGGDCAKGAFYNAQAVKCLQALAASGHANLVYTLPVYETALWSYVTYRLDTKTIQETQNWATAQSKHEMLAYTYFLQLLDICIPDLKEYVALASQLNNLSAEFQGLIISHQIPRVPLSALHPFKVQSLPSSPFLPIPGFTNGDMMDTQMIDQRTEALRLVAALRNLYYEAGFINTTMRTSANTIIEHGFAAMEAWFAGDTAAAAENARTTLIQSSLQDFPRFPSLIHIHFSCFVCLYLAEDSAMPQQQMQGDYTESPWIDYVELGVKAFTRVSHYRWIRVLIDYFVQRLDAYLGRHVEIHTCPLRHDSFDQDAPQSACV